MYSPIAPISAWGRLESSELEFRLGEQVRHQEVRQALASVGAAIFIDLVFMTTDYQITTPRQFEALLIGRIAFAFLSAMVLLSFRRILSPRARTAILFGWVVCGSVLMTGVGSTRSSEYFAGQVLMTNFILLVYLVVPLTLRLQVIGALLFTAGDLYHLLARHRDINGVVFRAMLITYLLTNLMGAITSRNRHHLKREQFLVLQLEIEMRASLEEALAEVRTLRGILPICSHCKRIRNEEGAWEAVDRYVRDHTHAEFSHGICPQCLEPLLRDLKV